MDAEVTKSYFIDPNTTDSSSYVDGGMESRFSAYVPITVDTINLNDEILKKKVTIFSLLGFVINIILFLYIGPTPWSRQMQFEAEELTIAFYAWDAMTVAICILFLLLGMSKKTISSESEIRGFKIKMEVLIVVYVVNWLLLLFMVEIQHHVFLGLSIRTVAVVVNALVWYHAKRLEYALGHPIALRRN